MRLGVRFLHVVWRQMVDAECREVDEIMACGEKHLTWEEAVEREVSAGLSASRSWALVSRCRSGSRPPSMRSQCLVGTGAQPGSRDRARRVLYRLALPIFNGYRLIARPRTRSVACVITHRDEVLLVRHTYRD